MYTSSTADGYVTGESYFEMNFPSLSANNRIPNETITYEIADFVPMKNKQYSDEELFPWGAQGNRHERRKQRKLNRSRK